MRKPLAVVITSASLARDSRTYKQVLSLVRFGYDCVVMQGEEGDLDQSQLPFTLRTIERFHDTGKKNKQHRSAPAPHESPTVKAKKPSWKRYLPAWLRYAVPFGRYLFRLGKYNRALAKRIPQASIYFVHYFDSAPAVSWVAKRSKAPIIYDAHDCHVRLKQESELNERERSLIKPLHKKLEAFCISRASAVVTVCDGVARLQKEIFGCDAHVLRNCHDARLDRYTGLPLKQKLGLPSDTFLVVVVGTAKKGMAFATTLRALQKLPLHVHLAFLGNGYGNFLQGVDYESVRERVHLPGAVKPHEVVPCISDADAALLIYYNHSDNYLYSLPNGFFQSLSAGLPLLYPELPEIARLASQYSLGLPVDPKDSASIQKGIQHLVDCPEDRQRFRTNCLNAAQQLSWEREELRFRELLATVSCGRHSPCVE